MLSHLDLGLNCYHSCSSTTDCPCPLMIPSTFPIHFLHCSQRSETEIRFPCLNTLMSFHWSEDKKSNNSLTYMIWLYPCLQTYLIPHMFYNPTTWDIFQLFVFAILLTSGPLLILYTVPGLHFPTVLGLIHSSDLRSILALEVKFSGSKNTISFFHEIMYLYPIALNQFQCSPSLFNDCLPE